MATATGYCLLALLNLSNILAPPLPSTAPSHLEIQKCLRSAKKTSPIMIEFRNSPVIALLYYEQ